MTPILLASLLSALGGLVQDPDGPLDGTPPPPEEDLVVIELGQAIQDRVETAPSGTRLLLYLVDEQVATSAEPADGPMPFLVQPIASWDLKGQAVRLMPGEAELRVGRPDHAHPVPPSACSGRFRAQVLIDFPETGPGPGAPGDLVGPVRTVELDPERKDILLLELDRARTGTPPLTGDRNLVNIVRTSERLPAVRGDAGTQSAWVVLPRGYHDLDHERRFWPTIYLIPDSEPAERMAGELAQLIGRREVRKLIPQAIWVVLDPIGPFGHHYFIDSPVNGQRRRALVDDLIPWLDVRFRTIPEPRARMVFGEGAGARAALGLLAEEPDTFGKAWAISPDVLGFEHLGSLDLYRMQDAFLNDDGRPRPAVRTPLGSERDRIHATVRDEVLVTNTLSNDGHSGGRWDALRATFGQPRPESPFPPWPFDLETGRIDPLVAADWSVKDLLQGVKTDPERADRLRKHARILGGARDEWYRDEGILALAEVLGVDPMLPESPIHLKPDATSATTSSLARMGAWEEIIDYFVSEGLQD